MKDVDELTPDDRLRLVRAALASELELQYALMEVDISTPQDAAEDASSLAPVLTEAVNEVMAAVISGRIGEQAYPEEER